MNTTPNDKARTEVPPVAEAGAPRGVSRRGMIGAAGAGVAAALLAANPAEATSQAEGFVGPLSSAQVKSVVAVAKAMATVPVALPHRPGRDAHPLDLATTERIQSLVAHLAPDQLALTRQGADTLAARLPSLAPTAVAVSLATHPEWDTEPAMAAALTLAAAVVTPLGFCAAFPEAWLLLLRSRAWTSLPGLSTEGAR